MGQTHMPGVYPRDGNIAMDQTALWERSGNAVCGCVWALSEAKTASLEQLGHRGFPQESASREVSETGSVRAEWGGAPAAEGQVHRPAPQWVRSC